MNSAKYCNGGYGLRVFSLFSFSSKFCHHASAFRSNSKVVFYKTVILWWVFFRYSFIFRIQSLSLNICNVAKRSKNSKRKFNKIDTLFFSKELTVGRIYSSKFNTLKILDKWISQTVAGDEVQCWDSYALIEFNFCFSKNRNQLLKYEEKTWKEPQQPQHQLILWSSS